METRIACGHVLLDLDVSEFEIATKVHPCLVCGWLHPPIAAGKGEVSGFAEDDEGDLDACCIIEGMVCPC